MAKIIINKNLLNKELEEKLIKCCPFGAIKYNHNNDLFINDSCRLCRICIKQSNGAFEFVEETAKQEIDKSLWRGIAVYTQLLNNKVHPVTFELIAKAKELASIINQEVYSVLIGSNQEENAKELLRYGADKVYLYDDEKLIKFDLETHTAIIEDFIDTIKPNTMLYGATSLGRSLAPRVAARYKTGLTADCTELQMKENSDLVQIRPAFGGNIMAQIVTTNHRPQLATVRYRVFDKGAKVEKIDCDSIIRMKVKTSVFKSNVKLLEVIEKEKKLDISEADIIIAVGRPFQTKEDLALAKELADLLNGVLGCTRPLIESGLMDASRQIGLSGRSVKTKLIITLGVSGAIQFSAGVSSDVIIAVDKNPNAQIFEIANYAIIEDIFTFIPELINQIKEAKKDV